MFLARTVTRVAEIIVPRGQSNNQRTLYNDQLCRFRAGPTVYQPRRLAHYGVFSEEERLTAPRNRYYLLSQSLQGTFILMQRV